MNNFINKTEKVLLQTFSCAAIIDEHHTNVGKIIIRFTKTRDAGYNHEIGILFYRQNMNFNDTYKGCNYDNPSTLFRAFTLNDVKCYHNLDEICNYTGNYKNDKSLILVDSLSQFSDINTIKVKGDKHSLLWVM